jgi:hypothetical protein
MYLVIITIKQIKNMTIEILLIPCIILRLVLTGYLPSVSFLKTLIKYENTGATLRNSISLFIFLNILFQIVQRIV